MSSSDNYHSYHCSNSCSNKAYKKIAKLVHDLLVAATAMELLIATGIKKFLIFMLMELYIVDKDL
ncbi:MAG: hypothetical protein J7L51_02635 [Desulfurococcales archaeon]|nr:hypothetical protein [Desulfurococcales archaeon]